MKVSVGLPVYNGERFLGEAIASFLAQTFTDFELIICDNASTDRTGAIAQQAAARDPRVRYVRHAQNIGAARNFHSTLTEARAPYFRWAAADDLNAPTSLERCVEVLDRDPGVVLAYPKTRFIDETGRVTQDYDDNVHLQAPRASDRFRQLLANLARCNAAYGLVRTDVMRRIAPLGAYIGSDVCLLAELTLWGTFWEVPEYLFFRRFHSEAASAKDDSQLRTHYDPARTRHFFMREWRFLWEHLGAVRRAPLPLTEKLRLYTFLGRSALWNRSLLAAEVAGALRARWGRARTRAA